MANDHKCWFLTRAATHRAGAQLTGVASGYKLKLLSVLCVCVLGPVSLVWDAGRAEMGVWEPSVLAWCSCAPTFD